MDAASLAKSAICKEQGKAKMTTTDALDYLMKVKQTLQNQEGKYNEFLMPLTDFKNGRIDANGMVMRIKEIFKGNPDLILGFNNFLPPEYEIKLDEKKYVDDAMNFINKIKNRFKHEEHLYKSFLAILNKYSKENKTVQDIYREIALLFKDHPDLLDEFTQFLPADSPVAPHWYKSRAGIVHQDSENEANLLAHLLSLARI